MAGKIAASILSADFAFLGDQVKLVEPHADLIHVDAMDAHFVPPLSIGPVVVESLRKVTGLPLHCHLMVERPTDHFAAIAKAGGDSVTFHLEAVDDIAAVAEQARGHGLATGLAFKPETEPEQAAAVADAVDIVLCMSIEPGYSGQAFMPEALPRIERLRELLPDGKHIQVDGGVGRDNARQLREVGAELLVAATSIFGADDIAAAYRELAVLT